MFFYGILKNGDVEERNSENAFNDSNLIYLIRGDLERKSEKEFSFFKYTLYEGDKKIEDRIIKWGNLNYKLPETDTWGSVKGGSHNEVLFKVLVNNQMEVSFPSPQHSTEPIKAFMNLLIFLQNHNASIKQ